MSRVNRINSWLDEFSSVVNMFLSESELKDIATAICNDHRTLQQNKMRLFIECIKIWADDYRKGNYDLRNEQTCKVCSDIMTWIDEDQLYFPTV